MACAMEARMGRNSVVVATLLVHSVKMATNRERMSTVADGGTCCSGVSLSPSHLDKPDSSLPLARAKPPPSKIRIFQGILSFTVFQVRMAGGAFSFPGFFWVLG